MKKFLIKLTSKPSLKIFVFVILICSLPLILSLARYITSVLRDYYLESQSFYFNSNRLKKDNPLYQIDNWSGIGDFTIEVSMNSRKNNLLYSNFDITYDIEYTCPQDIICEINKNSGTIFSAKNEDSFKIVLTPTRVFADNESITVPITAKSTAPYVSTISAEFQIVVGKTGVSYSITDSPGQPYMMVSITNAITSYRVIEAFSTYQINDEIDINTYNKLSDTNKAKCVSTYITLNFNPNIIVLDTTIALLRESVVTNQLIGGVSYVNQIKFPMNATSSKEVRFYKIDNTKDYTYPFVNPTSIVTFTAE